jgi:hypothetical protein
VILENGTIYSEIKSHARKIQNFPRKTIKAQSKNSNFKLRLTTILQKPTLEKIPIKKNYSNQNKQNFWDFSHNLHAIDLKIKERNQENCVIIFGDRAVIFHTFWLNFWEEFSGEYSRLFDEKIPRALTS